MKKYSQNGFWIKKEGNSYRIGLSDKGQDDLGNVAFIEFLSTGKADVNESLIGVEAEKAMTELTSPLTGEIVEIHEEVVENPELLNSTKDEDNWLIVLNNVQESEWALLMDTSGL